jgi:sulfonate transport system permease protein
MSARDSRPAWVMPAASLVLLLLAWHVAWLLAGDDKTGDPLVPGLPDVLGSVKDLGNYWRGGLGVDATKAGGRLTWLGSLLGFGYNTGLTAWRLAAGLILGIGVGVLVAVAVSWSGIVRALFVLPANFARMLPLLAMVPLFDFWFGATEHGSILFIAFTAFVTVFAIGISAIGNVPPHYARYARSLGAGPVRTYLTVVLPAALPELRSGVLLAVGFGWSAAITSEYLGQEYGLGHIVQNAEFFGRTQMLALAGVIAVVLAVITYLLVERLMTWATRWSE